MKLLKNTVFIMFIVPFVTLFVLGVSFVNASNTSNNAEISIQGECGMQVPGGGSQILPWDNPMTFKATVPNIIGPSKEFQLENALATLTLPLENFRFAPGTAIDSINLTIESENNEGNQRVFSDHQIDVPTSEEFLTISIPDEVGTTIGSFSSGEEGEVILKLSEIRMNVVMFANTDNPVPLGLVCTPKEDEANIITSIPIDSEAPVITLNGDNPITVKQGDPYNEPGATANDNFDGDVSDNIKISGDVDTNTIGTYTVTYTVSDSVGNVSTVERTVNVVEPFGNWYTGEGPPSDELGFNGDSYLDLTTGDVYKRDPNTWTKTGNLKGDDGKQGSAILTGSGAPKADAGDIGDLYLDTKTGDVYEKTADGWKKIANLQGPAGPQGPKGPKGDAGSVGSSGSGDDGGGKGTIKTSTGSDKDGKGKSAQGGKLPKTATSLPTLILIGSLLATAGGVLFLRRRKAIE